MQEIWKDIEGYEGIYQVSNLGNVKGKQGLKQQGFVKNYPTVVLYNHYKRNVKRVSVLVAQAFVPNPNCYKQVRHIDNNVFNNKASNLEWYAQTEKHGYYGTRLYRIWCGIKQRCLNPEGTGYEHYGGRGIGICEEWKTSPEAFIEWALKNGYSDELSIDRIKNNEDYSPENCRWCTREEQERNKRTNHLLTYKGETHCVAEWAEITGISYNTIITRLQRGYDIEQAFGKKVNNHTKYEFIYHGKQCNLTELAQELGINKLTLKYRLDKGLSIEEITNLQPYETHKVPIRQLDKNGNLIKEYPSIKEAVKETGITNIHNVLDLPNRTAGNYKWERI